MMHGRNLKKKGKRLQGLNIIIIIIIIIIPLIFTKNFKFSRNMFTFRMLKITYRASVSRP
jgi:hypothetical protein